MSEEPGRGRPMHSSRARDRAAVRRALVAGTLAALVAAVPLVGLALGGAGEGSGRAAVAFLSLALAVGSLVGLGWLLIGVLLDLLADELPGRHRGLWGIGLAVFAAAFFLIAAAAQL